MIEVKDLLQLQKIKRKVENSQLQSKTIFLNLHALRRTFTVFILLYAVFAMFDVRLYPTYWIYLWVIRFGIVIPLLISTIILSHRTWFKRHHQGYITLNFIVGGLGIAIMLILNPEIMAYNGGLFMVYFSGYLLIQLQYRYAAVGGISIFLFHFLGSLLVNGIPKETEWLFFLFFIGANVIGVIGAYSMEEWKGQLSRRSQELQVAYQELDEKNQQDEAQLHQLNQFIQDNKDLNQQFQEREKLIRKLEYAQNRYDELSIQSKTFFYEVTTTGLFVYASASIEAVLGYHPSLIVSQKKLQDLLPLDRKTHYFNQIQEHMENQEAIEDMIHPIHRKNGQIIWIRSRLVPVFDASGTVLTYHGSGTDVTKEKGLIDDLQLFKTISDQSKYGSALSTIDGTLVYVNEAFCDMHGYSVDELLGRPIAIVHNPEQMSAVSSLLEQMLSKGSFTNEEVWHVRKNGEIFPTIMTGKLIRLDAEPRYFSATMFDITQEKKILVELDEAKMQFEKILSENDIPIASHTIVYDANQLPVDYRYDYVNPAFEQLIGIQKSNIIGKTVLELLPNTEKYWIDEFAKVALTQVSMRYTNYSSQFDKWFSVSAYSPQKGQFAVLISDITELKKHEEKVLFIYRHDSMTGLPNRMFFEEQIKEFEKENNLPVGIMMTDINGLKLINDSFGIHAGDQVLIQVSTLLQQQVRPIDFVARIGGDEFVIICPHTSVEQMDQLKEQLLDGVSGLMIEDIRYSLSIGYDIKTKITQNMKDILINAENDMHRTKVFHGQSVRSRAIMSIYSTLTNKYIDELVHSERVSDYCRLIGEQLHLNEEELNELTLAGKLHDIGKISIPDDVLKKPGKLTRDEWKIMKEHTVNGYQILRAADEYSELASYALTHHERIDGLGYPNGLKGEEIPLFSRIIHVADAYEAMTSNRPYRAAMQPMEAVQELQLHKGTQFDSEIVEIFIHHVLIHEI